MSSGSFGHTFATKTLHICIAFAIGISLQRTAFVNTDFAALVLTAALTVVGFSGVGILSAALLVLTKRGDPVQRIIVPLISFISGTYFPTSVLPHWLQYIAQICLLTWALKSARRAAMQGLTIRELRVELTILAAMALILLPLSVWAFVKAVERGRRDGSLTDY